MTVPPPPTHTTRYNSHPIPASQAGTFNMCVEPYEHLENCEFFLDQGTSLPSFLYLLFVAIYLVRTELRPCTTAFQQIGWASCSKKSLELQWNSHRQRSLQPKPEVSQPMLCLRHEGFGTFGFPERLLHELDLRFTLSRSKSHLINFGIVMSTVHSCWVSETRSHIQWPNVSCETLSGLHCWLR